MNNDKCVMDNLLQKDIPDERWISLRFYFIDQIFSRVSNCVDFNHRNDNTAFFFISILFIYLFIYFSFCFVFYIK